jgi:hypothetical protein
MNQTADMSMDEWGMLRYRLRDADPVLYQCLQRSWKIALDWWLYAVPVESGSSNSTPHLRNVERHLDDTIRAFEDSPNTAYTDRLTPAEIYILLSAVLFHDIGKTQKRGKKSHGELAEEYLNKKYADLGIPSVELAASLGRICAFHDPPESRSHLYPFESVLTTSIEPYGRIREPFIAALLLLADCMDASYTRALPPFLVEPDDMPAVGRFRRRIRGVYVDPLAGMVRTVLGSLPKDGKGTPAASGGSDRYFVSLNKAYEAIWGAIPDADFKSQQEWIGTVPISGLIGELKTQLKRVREKRIQNTVLMRLLDSGKPPEGSLLDRGTGKSEKTVNQLLSLGMIRLEASSGNSRPHKSFPFPRYADVAIAIGDMLSNCIKLDQIKGVLASEGVVIKSWVLEHDRNLYNAWNEPTYEPILTMDFMNRVLGGMWSLSASVFGTSRFSFVDLASYIGEPIVQRVAYAVRRISIVAGSHPQRPAIEAGVSTWEWYVLNRGISETDAVCNFIGPKALSERIGRLAAPNAGFEWAWTEPSRDPKTDAAGKDTDGK